MKILSKFSESFPIMSECDHVIFKLLARQFLIILTNAHENITKN